MARPTKYTKKMGLEICERLASGESMRSICRDDAMPDKTTVMRWLLSESPIYKGFHTQYAQARQIQYEFLADEIFDVADDGRNDYMEREDSEYPVFNGEAVGRSRLRVDTRKWFLSKVLPKFSDKQQESGNNNDAMFDAITALINKLPG